MAGAGGLLGKKPQAPWLKTRSQPDKSIRLEVLGAENAVCTVLLEVGVVGHACTPGTWEAKQEDCTGQGQLGSRSETV